MNAELAYWIEEDGMEAVQQQLNKWRTEAEKSYEGTTLERKHCHRCGELMRADSMAYHEGYHFDTCY